MYFSPLVGKGFCCCHVVGLICDLVYFYQVIFKMVEENPRDVGHEMDGLSIVYGDESLPRLYENSRISSEQLPSQQGLQLPLFKESHNSSYIYIYIFFFFFFLRYFAAVFLLL